MQEGLISLLIVSLVFAGEATPHETSRANRIVLEGQPATLRLVPHVTTTIYLPETINSIVVGEPNFFQAEHSPNEPLLVFVKPVTTNPAESNLLISTIRGQHFIFVLTTVGPPPDQGAADLLVVCKTSGFRFIDETFPTAVVSEPGTLPGNTVARAERSIDFHVLVDPEELGKLLEHQSRQEFPRVHGEGIRVVLGETLERGRRLIVLFSVFNSGSGAVELLPPQVQLAGQISSGILHQHSRWSTVQQLSIDTYRISGRRLNPGQRIDGLVVFERPATKQSNEHLVLQIADSAAVDRPILSPINYRQNNRSGEKP